MAKCRLGKTLLQFPFNKGLPSKHLKGQSAVPTPKKLAVVPAILEQITTAVLLWMLKVAKNYFSVASCKGLSDLFKKMFPDPVTEGFTLSRSKASYLISDGLEPILAKHLMKEINITHSAFTLMYDETTTKQVIKQMDILVRFWLETFFLFFEGLVLWTHAKGVDVAHSTSNIIFDEEFKFPADHLFNLSPDGPNVNKEIWKRMIEALEERMGPLTAFIPCNLHVVHNSFWEGLNLYGTQAEEQAFDLHYWFKRSPSKCEYFLELQEDTELDDSLFI